MRFGWCGKHDDDEKHARCKFQLIPTMGVHRGHLMVCDCSCHEGREPDFTGLPEGTEIATEDNKIMPQTQ